MKTIKYIILLSLLFGSCTQKEGDLLDSKLYFENPQVKVELEDGIDTYEYKLTSRISNLVSNDVSVEYQIGNAQMVEQYNQKHGTKYEYMPTEYFSLVNTSSVVKKGLVYSEPSLLSLKNLSQIPEGKSYLIPIEIKNGGLPTIESKSMYLVINKPIVINKVFNFNGRYLSIPMPSTANFKSVTYEALIYADNFVKLSTILGAEGNLLLRFGDLPKPDEDQVQIAGGVQFNPPMKFAKKKWYHIAFVFNGDTKMAEIFVNGEKVADKTADLNGFNLAGDFFIGYAYDYDPNRTWRGKMSECRIWNIARTASELKENMLSVNPNSEGLFGYWKLNGTDYYQKDGKHYVKDQSKNKLDATSRQGRYRSGAGISVAPNIVNLKVKL